MPPSTDKRTAARGEWFRIGGYVSGFSVPSHPGSSSAAASSRMSVARRRDTKAEVLLRRELHARGLRYRVALPIASNRRRSIDIAFTRARLAVFVDGCFWHACPEHGTAPVANSEWWKTKLGANVARDRDTTRVLEDSGWTVLRIWEHVEPGTAADIVVQALRALRAESP